MLGGGGVDTWVGLFSYFLIYLGACASVQIPCVYVCVCLCIQIVCVCADTGWMGGGGGGFHIYLGVLCVSVC